MARPKFPSDSQAQYMVRLPDGLRDRIKSTAESNNRSMNAEIVATLLDKYPEPIPPDRLFPEALRIMELRRNGEFADEVWFKTEPSVRHLVVVLELAVAGTASAGEIGADLVGAEEEGTQAAVFGHAMGTNPYVPGTPHHLAWVVGYGTHKDIERIVAGKKRGTDNDP